MRKWYLIEDCTTSRAAVFHTMLKATDEEDAIAEGLMIWNALTDHDKRDREAVYVCESEPDEYGDPDFDAADHFTDLRAVCAKMEEDE